VTADRSFIRVKAMLIAPNDEFTAHAVSLNPSTQENPDGYHRLIGGSVELGETHHDAMVREVQEELGAEVHDLSFVDVVESIFRINGALGYEVVFLYTGRLDSTRLASGRGRDSHGERRKCGAGGWRRFHEEDEPLPLYPEAAASYVRGVVARRQAGG
jgi:ADP-ribose pyrophosphatase YjhB (NUDIX family)